jgi:hypothetical protein
MYSTRQLKPGKKMPLKKGFGFIFCVLLSFMMVFPVFAANLLDVYKRGEIVLKADPEFGKNVDWEEWFYHYGLELAVVPGGNIYVINSKENNILEFNRDGQFVRKFGQRGQGPLDFISVKNPSILDSKYLVVGEYLVNRKITLVDMAFPDTRHVKVLKTKSYVSFVTALKDNKIAYMVYGPGPKPKDKGIDRHQARVIIKDVVTSKETIVATYNYSYQCKSEILMIFVLTSENLFPRVSIARTKEGNLMVSSSDTDKIDIFSLEGKKIKSFNLQYSPIKVTKEFRNKIVGKFVGGIKSDDTQGKWTLNALKSNYKDVKLFGEHLPYYKKILVDADGNFLVFPNSLCAKDCEIVFRVYSPEGSYVCTTKINKGNFKFGIKRNRLNFIFSDDGIFGLFDLKNDEDISVRLVKVKY